MASAAGGSGTGGGDRCGMYVSWNKMCMCCGMHHLVFVMHLVALFWHSNDVFIGAHMETIEKFKKYMFWIMNMSLTLILQ